MSASIPSPQQHGFHARSNARATLTAFVAIVSRDLLVIRREILVFLLQTLIQPLFFLFVFGKVLPTIGAASASFSTVLLPGVVALTVFLTALQGPRNWSLEELRLQVRRPLYRTDGQFLAELMFYSPVPFPPNSKIKALPPYARQLVDHMREERREIT